MSSRCPVRKKKILSLGGPCGPTGGQKLLLLATMIARCPASASRGGSSRALHDSIGGPLSNQTLGLDAIVRLLGDQADNLLGHVSKTIPKERLHLPGPDFVDRIFGPSDRSPRVLAAMQRMFGSGRLSGTGYLSILPVDQGIEHSGGASFAKNPDYFDPENIIELAIEGGCNAVATTSGALAFTARKYAHKIPFMLKLNHNELLSVPNAFDQVFFAQVEQAWNMGCTAVGATIYFGSSNSTRQIQEVSKAFQQAHELGMATVLWCYLRNDSFKVGSKDYHVSADLTGQANHMGVTIQADIIKQKLPEVNGGYAALNMGGSSYGKFDKRIYTELSSDHPIDLTRYQVANCYMGRAGLINSGGASGSADLEQAVATAVINKRAGGMGLISGRKAFQKPRNEGIALLNAIQDVYLEPGVTIA
jgi:class I fructose-bisphosphate aldolase